MPIFEITCHSCGGRGEILVVHGDDELLCPHCGSHKTDKLMSATSSSTGRTGPMYPGAGDNTCCGNRPSEAGCSGPGSCCGKTY